MNALCTHNQLVEKNIKREFEEFIGLNYELFFSWSETETYISVDIARKYAYCLIP